MSTEEKDRTEQLRDIIKDMLKFLETPTEAADDLDFDDLIELGQELSVQCEQKRQHAGDVDEDLLDYEFLEIVEGEVNEENPFNPENFQWSATEAEAFNRIANEVVAGKKSFRFRRNKKTGEIIQVMYG
jgi:hypothetical protein